MGLEEAREDSRDSGRAPPKTMHSTARTYGLTLAASAVLGVLAALQMWVNTNLEGYPRSLPPLVGRHVASWATWGLVAPTVFGLTRRWPLLDAAWRRALWKHTLVGLGFSLVHRPLHVWFVWYPVWGGPNVADFVRDFTFFSLFTDFAIYWGLVGGRTILDQRELLRMRDVRTAALKGQLAESRLAALEERLHPHFLFNTLAALRALQSEGRTEEATRMLDRLSELLRVVLERGAAGEVSLREELRLARPYVDLMRMRYGERLTGHFDVSPEAADGLVPRMLLQPLIENAFVHGIDARSGAGRLEIRAEVRDGELFVEVEDDGPGPRLPVEAGLGLSNVRERLSTRHGERASLELVPASDAGASGAETNAVGTIARVRLPWRVGVGELEESP